MPENKILIGHGSGGRLSRNLINGLFRKYFHNKLLDTMGDSSLFDTPGKKLAFTTDSFVVDPLFFPGGNIGKLAISGTVNDLSVAGAIPLYLSCGFIIEEGFELKSLEKIVHSMAREASLANIQIITGDTKIVPRGQADKVFINTSGIGVVPENRLHLNNPSNFQAGDKIIVSGNLGDHALAILAERENLKLDEQIFSDVAPLNELVGEALAIPETIKAMRDITRGGLATVLVELCENENLGIRLQEDNIPVRNAVRAVCEIYGFDPLYLANEGKIVFIADAKGAESTLQRIKGHALGKNARIIGELTREYPGKVTMRSVIGGTRIVNMLNSEMLPRIC